CDHAAEDDADARALVGLGRDGALRWRMWSSRKLEDADLADAAIDSKLLQRLGVAAQQQRTLLGGQVVANQCASRALADFFQEFRLPHDPVDDSLDSFCGHGITSRPGPVAALSPNTVNAVRPRRKSIKCPSTSDTPQRGRRRFPTLLTVLISDSYTGPDMRIKLTA